MADAVAPAPKYNYAQVPPAAIPVAQLDAIMLWVMAESPTLVGRIFAGVKIAIIALYFIARDKLIAQEVLRIKQQNEQERETHNQDVVDGAAPVPPKEGTHP